MAREQEQQGRSGAGREKTGAHSTGKRQMRCSSCDQTFKTDEELREHQKKMHRDQSRS
jgi:uncharacterized C2H2 Zn-finger protein